MKSYLLLLAKLWLSHFHPYCFGVLSAGKVSMQHVGSVMLGYERDQSLRNAMKIVALGFPDGAVFICAWCSRVEFADVAETAKAMMEGWPRCHGARMTIEGRQESEAIAIRSRPTYRIILESELGPVPDIIRLRQLIKFALRSLGFRCVHLAEITAKAETVAEISPPKPPKP